MSDTDKEKKPLEISTDTPKRSGSPEKLIPFRCIRCGLSEDVHYFGKKPDFVRRQLEFAEPSYVMRDPFSPRTPGRAHFLLVGGVCAGCSDASASAPGGDAEVSQATAAVCVDCSVFCGRRFCLDCASGRIKEFPGEVQARIQKMLDAGRK